MLTVGTAAHNVRGDAGIWVDIQDGVGNQVPRIGGVVGDGRRLKAVFQLHIYMFSEFSADGLPDML